MHITNMTVKQFNEYIQNSSTSIQYYKTAAGKLKVYFSDYGIYKAEFDESQINNHDTIFLKSFPNKLLLIGTDFQLKVWQALMQNASGNTISYYVLAKIVGHPKSWRAVANAVAQNRIAYFIPCHRVIRKNGKLGGYKWGIEKKMILIKAEAKDLGRIR